MDYNLVFGFILGYVYCFGAFITLGITLRLGARELISPLGLISTITAWPIVLAVVFLKYRRPREDQE